MKTHKCRLSKALAKSREALFPYVPEANFKSKAILQSSRVKKLAGRFRWTRDTSDSIPPGPSSKSWGSHTASLFATAVTRHFWRGSLAGKLLRLRLQEQMAGGRVHAPLSSRARWAGLPKPSRAAGLWRQSTGYHKATWQHRLQSGGCARQAGFVARMVAQDHEDGAAGRDTGLTLQSCASLPLHPKHRTSPLSASTSSKMGLLLMTASQGGPWGWGM